MFRAMFATNERSEEMQPSPFVLSDIHPTIFLALLEFIYTNCCSLSTDMVITCNCSYSEVYLFSFITR